MKLQKTRDIAIGSEPQETFSFQIEANEKTFQMTMGSLYTNPIKAFIRELGTNAYEAHQLVNKEHIPFDVTLPTMLNPSFIIRDYGPGLSKDDVRTLYTVLMKSSKENTNEYGGCFGLGSKSPFAYTSNFGVISHFDGVKYCYSVCKDVNGLPKMSLMHSEECDEPSGLEISIPIKSYDFQNVINEANKVYYWFATKPKITNGELSNTYEITLERDGFRYVNGLNCPHAKMGNIIYEISRYNVGLGGLDNIGCVIDFEIGELTPVPSRDQLQYDSRTKTAIATKIQAIISQEKKLVQEDIDKCESYLEACKLAHKNKLFRVEQFSWNNIRLESYITRLGDRFQYYNYYKYSKDLSRISGGYYNSISSKSDFVFFYLDDTKNPLVRIRHYLNELQSKECVVITNFNTPAIKKDSNKKVLTKQEFAKIYHINEKDIIDANDLEVPKVVKTKAVSKAGLKIYSNKSKNWNQTDPNSTVEYYCELKNDKAFYNGIEVRNSDVWWIKHYLGIKENIYGLNQAIIKKHDTSKYKNIFDIAKKELIKIWENSIQVDDTYELVYLVGNLSVSMKKATAFSEEIAELYKQYEIARKIRDSAVDRYSISGLLQRIWPNELLVQPTNNFAEVVKKVLDKYPLVQYISDVPEKIFLDYLKLVEKKGSV